MSTVGCQSCTVINPVVAVGVALGLALVKLMVCFKEFEVLQLVVVLQISSVVVVSTWLGCQRYQHLPRAFEQHTETIPSAEDPSLLKVRVG